MKKCIAQTGMALLLLISVFFLSREGAQLTNGIPKESKGVIVVDSGQGGMDPGVIGQNELKEKEINLVIAKKLERLLKADGYKVVMTRKKDEGLYENSSPNKKVQDMQKRCEIIKENQPLLTVSIHQNSYPDEQVCGPQVFYFESSPEGQKLAKSIQDSLNTELEIQRPRVEKSNRTYYLLKRSEGVLNIVECGFLSNKKEAELLTQDAYQEKVAKAVEKGILKYLED